MRLFGCVVPRLPSPGHYEPGAVGLLGPSLSEHGQGLRLGTEGSPEERVEPAGRSRGSGIKNRAGRRASGAFTKSSRPPGVPLPYLAL